MAERAPWDNGPAVASSLPVEPERAPWDQMRAADPQPIINHLQNSPGMADAKNPLDAFYAGLQVSDTGLLSGRPNMRLPENASFMEKLAAGFGQGLGDLPITAPTAAVTRSPSATFAAPEAVRQLMMDYYHKDQLHTSGDFVRMLANNAWEVGKAAVVGKIAGVLGTAGASVTSVFTANGFAKTAANIGGFTLGATTANAALEGRLPNAQDFILGAVNAVGFHFAFAAGGRLSTAGERVAGNLKTIYRETGATPGDAASAAHHDPILHDELVQTDVNGKAVIPKFNAMRPPAAEPFVKTDAPDPAEHSDKLYGILKDAGHEEVPVGLARKYGYDPAKLNDQQNEAAARSILSALSERYSGDSETALIAFRDGTETASKYIASGRDPEAIPDDTQTFLKHVQDGYGIYGQWRQVNWNKFPTAGDTTMRLSKDGTYKPAPSLIAGYLQDFGRRAGFRFVVGPNREQEASLSPPESISGAEPGPQYQVFQGSVTQYGHTHQIQGKFVYIPDEPDALGHRWYGLGRYEILHHEVGHALDDNVLNFGTGPTKELDPELAKELEGVSRQFRPKLWEIDNTTKSGYNLTPAELMADGIATWMSRPDLRSQMPIFGRLHGETLKPYLNMANSSLPVRSEGGSGQWVPPPGPEGPEPHLGATPPSRGGQGGKPPVPPNLPPEREHNWDRAPMSTLLSRFSNKVGEQPIVKKKLATGLEFELDAAKRLDQTMLRQGLLKPGQITTEDVFRNTYGSEGRWRAFMKFGPIDFFTRKPTGAPSWEEISNDIDAAESPALEGWTDKRTAFNAYVLAERSMSKANGDIDAKGRVAPIGLYEPGEAETIVRRLRPIFGAVKDKMQQFNHGVLDYAVASGRISRASADAMISADPSYMAIRRIMGDDASFETGPGKGKFFRSANPYKRMEGDNRDITDPFFATIDNARLVIQEADRNAAKGHIVMSKEAQAQWGLKQLEDTGATIAQPGSDVFRPYRFSPGEEEAISRAFGFRVSNSKQFSFYHEGKFQLWEAKDDDLARLIRGADSPGELNWLTKILGIPAAVERLGVTGDPGFAFGIPLKHQWTAFISGKGHPPPYFTAIRGAFHMLKMDDVYQQALANGAMTHGAMTDIDKALVQTDALGTLEKTGALQKAWNVVRHPIQFSQMITETMTNASRVGNFAREVAKGKEPFKAAMESRTNFLDYSEQMTAQWAQTFAKWVPFFRAGVLGLRQGYEAATERPAQTAMYLTMGLILPQIFLYALNRLQDQFLPDDQKYTNLPNYERDLYLHSPVIGPNGYRFRLGKPFVAGPLVGAPLERVLEKIFEANPHAFDGLLTEMGKDLSPSNIPAFIKAPLEQLANYNFFTGQPLISDRLKAASADLQYTDATTEPAKKISQLLSDHHGIGIANIPPVILDNYVREWGGTLGVIVMKVLGAVMKPESPDDWTETPFVKAFLIRHPALNAAAVDDFYRDAQSFEQAHQDKVLEVQRGLLSDARTDAVKQRVVTLEKFKHTLNLLREGIVRTNGNTTMTVDEKRQLTDQLVNEGIAFAQLGSRVLATNKYDPEIAQVLTQNINESLHRALTPVTQ